MREFESLTYPFRNEIGIIIIPKLTRTHRSSFFIHFWHIFFLKSKLKLFVSETKNKFKDESIKSSLA